MSSEITLTYTLDPSDYLVRRSALWRWVRVFFMAVAISFFVVAGLLYLTLRGEVDVRVGLLGFGFSVLAVGFFAAIWAANSLLTAPKRLRERFQQSPSLLRPHSVVTAEEGLYVTTEESELLLRWSLIDRARVTAKMLVIYHANEVLLAIPFRAFENQESAEAFLTILRNHNVVLREFSEQTS